MKFRFPLQNVIKHRQILEDLAEKDFRDAEGLLREQERVLRDMRMQVIQSRDFAFKTQVQGGTAGGALRHVDEFLKLQDLRIAAQLKKVQDCEKRVEELREILRLRAIDTKIIESLKDRRKKEFKQEQSKYEQKQNDEQATMRYLRK